MSEKPRKPLRRATREMLNRMDLPDDRADVVERAIADLESKSVDLESHRPSPIEGAFAYVGFRCPPLFKTRLEHAPRWNGRSLSQEVVSRLELDFSNKDLLTQTVLAIAGASDGKISAQRVLGWLRDHLNGIEWER